MSADAEAASSPRFHGGIRTLHFRKFVDGVRAVADDVHLRIGADGLEVGAVDQANVLALDAHLDAAIFSRYDVDATGVHGFQAHRTATAIDHQENAVVTEPVPPECSVAIDGDEFVFVTDAGRETAGAVNRSRLRSEPDLPAIDEDLVAEVTISGVRFRKLMREVPEDDRSIELQADPDAEAIHIRTGEDDQPLATLDAEDSSSIRIDETASSLYSRGYLHDIADATYGSPPVRLRFGDYFPLVISYPLVNRREKPSLGRMEYTLAPRIPPGGEAP